MSTKWKVGDGEHGRQKAGWCRELQPTHRCIRVEDLSDMVAIGIEVVVVGSIEKKRNGRSKSSFSWMWSREDLARSAGPAPPKRPPPRVRWLNSRPDASVAAL